MWSEEKNKKIQNFLKVFLKGKNKHVLIRKFNPVSNEKQISLPNFVQYKKVTSIYFLFTI
jgi:hypothetical protein